ncbi:cysteine hydrolase family protein [Allostella humosa]|uniref:cysteine hydrolase family protein n=1 Tax=Stella humosa TaxID=94 RepID=UPI001476B584|nr:cysteine hydrolase [Stella humosa]
MGLHEQWAELDFPALLGGPLAFVSIDAQNSILDPEGVLAGEGIWVGAREQGGSLANMLRLAGALRRPGNQFLWLRYDRFVGERETGSVLDRAQYAHWNRAYRGDAARKAWEAELVADVEAIRQPADVSLVYPGWSIFAGTPIERWLAQWGIRTLVITGYHTDWCVEMAARSARELGLVPIVIGDATGTTHPLHEQTLAQINDAYAPVIDTAFALEAIAAAGAR